MADAETAPTDSLETLAAAMDVPVPTDDAAVLRRVKALAATRPLHDLNRNKAMWSTDGIDWEGYDLLSLALATIDTVALNQTLSSGSTFDEVITFCAAQAARQNPVGAEAETARVAERIVEALAADQSHTLTYSTFNSEGRHLAREWSFRLFDQRWRSDGETLELRATQEAINVLIDGLDIDVESAQLAAETQMRTLITRGALEGAVAVARRARNLTSLYLEQVATVVRDTLVDLDIHDWEQEIPALFSSALAHVADRVKAEMELMAAIEEQRERAADSALRRTANALIILLSGCRSRHLELQAFLLRSREDLRRAVAEGYRPQRRSGRLDIEADLLVPLLAAPAGRAAAAADGLVGRFAALARRWWPSGAVLIDECFAAEAPPTPGVEVPDPLFDDAEAEPWWVPYWDVAAELFDALETPARLSELVAQARFVAGQRNGELDADAAPGELLDPDVLVAAVCHVAHQQMGCPLGPFANPQRVVAAVATGDAICDPALDADDLLVVPGVAYSGSSAPPTDPVPDRPARSGAVVV